MNKTLLLNDLDLNQFFYAIQNLSYVIVRRSNPEKWPGYFQGEDIDIFCYDKAAVGRKLLGIGNIYVNQGFDIESTDHDNGMQTHIDFFKGGQLQFRFDLYGRLPRFKKVCIKEHLFLSVIENAHPLEYQWQEENYPLYIPSSADDLLLRYIEYVEYFEQRPDKIKHLDYIMSSISDVPGRLGFIEKLHQYTDLPKCIAYIPEEEEKAKHYAQSLRYHFKMIVNELIRRIKP